MAKKKKSNSRFSLIKWLLLLLTSGGGAGGYFNRDLPVIGPVVQKLMAASGLEDSVTGQELAGKLLNGHPGAESLLSRLAGDDAPPAGMPQSDLAGGQPGVQLASAKRPSNSILIASFNIQVLGKSKMSKPGVVDILAHIIRQFDIVAIQEVRAKDDDILPSLVAAVNADGSQFSYLIGPRLGRSVSTEQYAFVFDTNRIETDPSAQGTIQDPSDLMHREPFVARFRTRTSVPDQAFSFWLVNIHTDPDEVPQEVDALADVFQIMQTARPDEDDVILLGDLNASETQLGRLGQIPGIHWAVRGVMTNTRQSKAYDNILFHSESTSEFTGRWGVYDMQRVYGISQEDALKVSDHLPVWAEFGAWETPSQGRFADRLPRGLR